MAYVVAIPALNEETHIAGCLEALDGQVGARLDHIVVFANNCTDGTAAAARSVKLTSGVKLHLVEATLAPAEAHAGMARRLAMEAAVPLAGKDGLLLTTDADGSVDHDWLAATLVAMETHGADAVAGWAELHPTDWGNIPVSLHEDDARECEYDGLCDEIHGRLDPDPYDPLPRHTQHSGASIAVTVDAYLRCGGVPAIACGEDRALIAALRRIDTGIRHDPAVRVVVSGRTIGRAAGGMADTIRRRLVKADDVLDDRLEPALDCVRRAWCRSALRQAYHGRTGNLADLATSLGLSQREVMTVLTYAHFGQAWNAIEASAPTLKRNRVAVANLSREVAAAQTILLSLEGGTERALMK